MQYSYNKKEKKWVNLSIYNEPVSESVIKVLRDPNQKQFIKCKMLWRFGDTSFSNITYYDKDDFALRLKDGHYIFFYKCNYSRGMSTVANFEVMNPKLINSLPEKIELSVQYVEETLNILKFGTPNFSVGKNRKILIENLSDEARLFYELNS